MEASKEPMSVDKLRQSVLAALMASLAAVGSYVYVPIGPVPLVLTTLFVLLSGLLLGSRWGLAAMALYLFIGAMGMPVFSGGRGGFPHFFGPTGGYLFGYLLSAWATGILSERFRGLLSGDVLAVIAGSLAIYLFGVPWLKFVTHMSWTKSLVVGMVPFILGDAVKAAGALILARAARPMLGKTESRLSQVESGT